jgi:hypothetical protein
MADPLSSPAVKPKNRASAMRRPFDSGGPFWRLSPALGGRKPLDLPLTSSTHEFVVRPNVIAIFRVVAGADPRLGPRGAGIALLLHHEQLLCLSGLVLPYSPFVRAQEQRCLGLRESTPMIPS